MRPPAASRRPQPRLRGLCFILWENQPLGCLRRESGRGLLTPGVSLRSEGDLGELVVMEATEWGLVSQGSDWAW